MSTKESPATRKTFFLDIDGTLLKYQSGGLPGMMAKSEVIPGTVEQLLEWRSQGHMIVLTTARPEGLRRLTEDQLYKHGIFYDMLIMGLTNGPRVLYNDIKPNGEHSAYAVNLVRDAGLASVQPKEKTYSHGGGLCSNVPPNYTDEIQNPEILEQVVDGFAPIKIPQIVRGL